MLFLVALAAVVGIVWGAIFLRKYGLLGGCTVAVLAGSCLGHAFYHVSVGPVPVTVNRVMIGVVVLLYLAARAHDNRGVDPKPATWSDLFAAVFLGVLILSTFRGDWRADGMQPVATLLFFFLLPGAVYVVARQSVLDRRRVTWMLGAVFVFGLYLAVTALAEVRGWHHLIWPRYIASPVHPEFLGRSRGPFLNPIGCGMYLSVGLLGGLATWPAVPARWRPVWTAGLILIGGGIVATLTRSVWLGTALALTIVAWMHTPRRARWAFVSVAGVLAVALLATQSRKLMAFKRDKHVSAYEMAQSASLRPVLAAVAWRMFQDQPLHGCGFGQYRRASLEYLWDRNSNVPLERARPYVQHNVALAILTETGLLGLGAFVLMMLGWLRDTWWLAGRVEAEAWVRRIGWFGFGVLVIYLVNGMFHDVGIIPMVNLLMALCLGTVSGVASRERVPLVSFETQAEKRYGAARTLRHARSGA